MMLEEAQALLKKTQINATQLDSLNSLYIVLDLDKDKFCHIVDYVGIDTLLKKQLHYDYLLKGWEELMAKERYLFAKSRLEELRLETENLERTISAYKPL